MSDHYIKGKKAIKGPTGKRYSASFIFDFLEEIRLGSLMQDVCRRHVVSTATAYTWCRLYRNKPLEKIVEMVGKGRFMGSIDDLERVVNLRLEHQDIRLEKLETLDKRVSDLGDRFGSYQKMHWQDHQEKYLKSMKSIRCLEFSVFFIIMYLIALIIKGVCFG